MQVLEYVVCRSHILETIACFASLLVLCGICRLVHLFPFVDPMLQDFDISVFVSTRHHREPQVLEWLRPSDRFAQVPQ